MTPIDPSAIFGPRIGRGRRSPSTPLGVFLAGALAALAASTVTFPGMAQASEVRRVVVSYGDLDLTGPHGVARLGRRVAVAARRICLGPENARHLFSNPSRCIAEAVSTAAPQVEQAVARRRAAMMVAVPPSGTRSR